MVYYVYIREISMEYTKQLSTMYKTGEEEMETEEELAERIARQEDDWEQDTQDN